MQQCVTIIKWVEMSFGQTWLFSQKVFQAEIASNENWTNSFLFGQKWLFGQTWLFDRNGIQSEHKKLVSVWPEIVFFAKNDFFARNDFAKFKMTYFLKYWKVWLAFDGWKLSGLFVLSLTTTTTTTGLENKVAADLFG